MKILISSFDMELGGVERSLVAMLENFDYGHYKVDLHLHSHSGPLMGLIPSEVKLLPELPVCKTYRLGIKDAFMQGYATIAFKRLLSRLKAKRFSIQRKTKNSGYYQMQAIWDLCVRNTENITSKYDVAISYLWPHHFTAYNVQAKTKIAWIHTDYSTIDIDVSLDLLVWQEFDYIVSISNSCTEAFLKIHPTLKSKIVLVENITNVTFVQSMSVKSIGIQLSKKTFNIVSVGRLSEQKAFDRAVEALHLVHKKGFTNIKWYVVGEGTDKEQIEELINRYQLQDSFILLGSTPNPYPYMNAADLYVQPSRYEGKAVTITEAQILAKPVLITNYATSSSQINHGFDGIICEQTVSSIADSIISLYEDGRRRSALSDYCRQVDYSNANELHKLYQLFI